MRYTLGIGLLITGLCGTAQAVQQKNPSIATAADGSYVIVWEDKTAKDIFARRYNASGYTLGDIFQVSTTAGDNKKPSVAMAADGSFIVAWENKTNTSVMARRYDTAGNAVGAEFQVNSSSGEHKEAQVSAAPDGSFVVVWKVKVSGTVENVLARRYTASGTPIGAEFQVNTGTGKNKKPSVGVSSTGAFVVVWENKDSGDVLMRRYDSSGTALGAPVTVGQLDATGVLSAGPTVAVASDGRFVIAWEDKNAKDLLVRAYDATGAPLGTATQVNVSTGEHKKPRVAIAPDGSFVVAWESKTSDTIQARRYNGSGTALGGQFQVNTSTSKQKDPAIAVAPDGSFIVTWQDKGIKEILGQRYDATGAAVGAEFNVNNAAGGLKVIQWREVPNSA
ncbi:MAG: hypothetical protein ACE5E1_08680 [Phycisphaerae bacterium]